MINGHEYVDLGLPSGLKWATCNVGASSPEEYGDYYAWGEIKPKHEYASVNSKTYDKSVYHIQENPTYDVARAKWGGSWRIPTKAEFEELLNNCIWSWEAKNGKKGYKVIGPNNNYIFMPAAGYFHQSSLCFPCVCGRYWSSTSFPSNDINAYSLNLNNKDYFASFHCRYHGLSVRPVSE